MFKHILRTAIVGFRSDRDPAGQTDWRTTVEVLHRILHPPGAPAREEKPSRLSFQGFLEILPSSTMTSSKYHRPSGLKVSMNDSSAPNALGWVSEPAAFAHDPVGQLVVRRHFTTIGRDARDVIGQRTVVADVEWSTSCCQRILNTASASCVGRNSAVPMTRRRNGTHSICRAHVVRPPGYPGIERPGLPGNGLDVWHEIEFIAKEAMCLSMALVHRFIQRQDVPNNGNQLVAPTCIDNFAGSIPRRTGVFDGIVRAEQQRIEMILRLPGQPLPSCLCRASIERPIWNGMDFSLAPYILLSPSGFS